MALAVVERTAFTLPRLPCRDTFPPPYVHPHRICVSAWCLPAVCLHRACVYVFVWCLPAAMHRHSVCVFGRCVGSWCRARCGACRRGSGHCSAPTIPCSRRAPSTSFRIVRVSDFQDFQVFTSSDFRVSGVSGLSGLQVFRLQGVDRVCITFNDRSGKRVDARRCRTPDDRVYVCVSVGGVSVSIEPRMII